MFFSKTAALAVALGAQQALAHVELIFPPGINSKFDPQTPQNKIDYSMTSPLNADGSNYPCKGYNTAANIAALKPVATLQQGQSFHINMSGSATHNGGSCQFSLSYDGGKTFGVITSIVGGCPLSESYDITIPQGVPSMDKALFAWTWQNNEGNREEYMNCAVVDVDGTSGASITLPQVFRSNTLPDASCITTEGVDVAYPNPGKEVQYKGSLTASSPATKLSPCSYNEDTTVTLSASGSSTGGSSGSGSSGSGSGSSGSATSSKASATSSKAKPTSSKAASTSTPPTVTSSASGSTGSSGSSGSSGSTGSSSGSGSGAAYIKCTGTDTWSLCDGTTCTPMGKVAPGTKCDAGSMEAIATRRQGKMARRLRRAAAHQAGVKAHS